MEVTQFTPASSKWAVSIANRSPAKSPTVWNVWRCTCRAWKTFTTWWTVDQGLSYGDVYHQNEVEQSTFNFEHSNADALFRHFGDYEAQAKT